MSNLCETSASLRIVHVTDIYTVEFFPHLKTLLDAKRAEAAAHGTKTVSVLTGDFLAPYLLASVDKGRSMMKMLNETPIDILTWGNHDLNDVAHKDVIEREKEFLGTLINSNMKSHASFKDSKCQTDKLIIQASSPDGSNVRKIGLCAVLTNSPDLYKPAACGGAKIDDPWETLKSYEATLKQEEKVDLVLPLCHLYEQQDERTCQEFDFPLILGGHDHHCVDRVIHGTRLLKPGQDARCASIIDITWASAADTSPRIEAETIDVTAFAADQDLSVAVADTHKILERLTHTQLATVPKQFRPLTSVGSRGKRVSMGTFLCNSIRDALNLHCPHDQPCCDFVLMKGANLRGGRDYTDGEQFSLDSMFSEIKEDFVIHVYKVPGKYIQLGLCETWKGPNTGWLQYSDDVEVNADGLVSKIAGVELQPDRIYQVGSYQNFPRASDNPVIGKYLSEQGPPPNLEAGAPARSLLLGFFADQAWQILWKAIDRNGDGRISAEELRELDTDGDGMLGKQELLAMLHEIAGFSDDAEEETFVEQLLLEAGDGAGEKGLQDGEQTLDEMNSHHAAREAEQNQNKKPRDCHRPFKDLAAWAAAVCAPSTARSPQ